MRSLSFRPLLSLIKFNVSVAVTFTAVTGYVVYAGQLDIHTIQLAIGVFILAAGSGALNEFQERKYDARMARTSQRPIPTGKISAINSLLISLALIFEGLFLLNAAFGHVTTLLGLFNIFWYNGLYTHLKRITPFAVVPGSLVGAIPVFMGWSAAGGNPFSGSIIYIAFFLFIWQVPHFWLLMLKYGEEYKAAGFPTINETINPHSLRIIIYTWIIATSMSSIMIPLFLANLSWSFFTLIFILNLTFIGVFTKLSFGRISEINLKKSFISINVYMLVFMVMLIVFHLI